MPLVEILITQIGAMENLMIMEGKMEKIAVRLIILAQHGMIAFVVKNSLLFVKWFKKTTWQERKLNWSWWDVNFYLKWLDWPFLISFDHKIMFQIAFKSIWIKKNAWTNRKIQICLQYPRLRDLKMLCCVSTNFPYGFKQGSIYNIRLPKWQTLVLQLNLARFG